MKEQRLLLDDITKAIAEGGDDPPSIGVADVALPDVYYDGTSFYIPNKSGGWVRVDKRSARDFLVKEGFSSRRAENEPQSQVDVMLVRIQTEHDVAYVGPLAGYKAGLYPMNGVQVLVSTSPVFLTPQAGEFPILRKLLENLLGQEQLLYFCSWLKVSLEMYRSGRWQPGQLLALAGVVGAGKNLLRKIITRILGGRVAFPHAFMTSRTIFSSDMFAAETLAIEDQQESTDIRARRNFGAAIKNVTANEDQRCERKHCDPLTLKPLWRIIISVNDDPERLQVIPPLDNDIKDKIMLFEVQKHEMPMPTQTIEEKAAFWAALEAELPMFVHFLDQWQIPADIACGRFGVEAYHNPNLATQLDELAPELRLFELYDRYLLSEKNPEWEGSAAELERELCSDDSKCSLQARKLLVGSNTCGNYLARLQRKLECKYVDLVSRRTLNGQTIWKLTWSWAGRAEMERAEKEAAAHYRRSEGRRR
jgi:hypothetical protein